MIPAAQVTESHLKPYKMSNGAQDNALTGVVVYVVANAAQSRHS
jgi:hypothetical protein